MTTQPLQKPVVMSDTAFTAVHFQEIRDEASAIFKKTGDPDCDQNWRKALQAVRWRHFSMKDWETQFAWENSFGQRKEQYYSH